MRTNVRLAEAAAVRRAATSLAARARVERRGDLTLTEVAALGRVAVDGPITPGEVAAQLRSCTATPFFVIFGEGGGLLLK